MTSIILFFLSASVWASQPPNALAPPQIKNPYDNGYTEQRYEEVLTHLTSVYEPLIRAKGGSFHIKKDWEDGAVNMWAERISDEYWLEVPGGMARYHLITEEGFIASLCHELGHLLGGKPGSEYISYEGQSDYYAGHECLQMVLAGLPPQGLKLYDSEAKSLCQDEVLCSRALSGMKSLTSYYAELERVPAPQFSTPSKVVVSETLTIHPPAQCRLDTFLAGYQKRPRPKCWYSGADL